MRRRGTAGILCLAMASVCLGCRTTPGGERGAAAPRSARIFAPPARIEFSEAELEALADRPDLLERLRTNPYAYFRSLTSPFTQRVCEEFADLAHEMPVVNLHGDAHLEQYAITPTAHGLDDFDEAGIGLAVVDLVRFATSIHFACRLVSFECDPDAAVDAFLNAYAAGLIHPDSVGALPSYVQRVRSASSGDREQFFRWTESLMHSVDPATRDWLLGRWRPFIRMMTELSGHDEAYYRIVRFGSSDIGIGSALDVKFLLRIRGESDNALDDVIVEIKPMNEVTAGCLLRAPTGGILRTLLPIVRMGRIRPAVLGYLPWAEEQDDNSQWWVHSWDFGYRELSIAELRNQRELEEIARDVGLQLGRGHCNGVAAPLEDQHRHAQAQSLRLSRDRVGLLAGRLGDQVYQSWIRFRERG